MLANGDYETGPMTGEFALTGDATGELFDELADDAGRRLSGRDALGRVTG